MYIKRMFSSVTVDRNEHTQLLLTYTVATEVARHGLQSLHTSFN